MHKDKCTLKFSSWKTPWKTPCLLERVQLPALIAKWKRDKNTCRLSVDLFLFLFVTLHTHTHSYFSLHFLWASQFSAAALTILMGWRAVLSLIGWERCDRILQRRGTKYQRDKMIAEANSVVTAAGHGEYRRCGWMKPIKNALQSGKTEFSFVGWLVFFFFQASTCVA